MMQFTAILLLAGCLQLSAASYGQEISMSRRQATLGEIFLEIHQQTGYFFYYDEALIQKARRINIAVKSESLDKVLAICFYQQPLQYVIDNQVIVVSAKKMPLIAVDSSGFPVSGKVVNQEDEPISNATILVQPGGIMTMTDENGFFLIPAVQKNSTIQISSVGYLTRKLGVSKDQMYLISLKRTDNKLDEVQVIAYGTSSRRLNTGTVSKVTSAVIEQQPVSNPLSAMQGRVPGLTIQQNTSVPGGGFKVQLRGQNSVRADGNDLFYVVDGVPYTSSSIASPYTSAIIARGNPLSAINPADIESIEVLKDADATAIYGSRGANGVVLITTKKGKAGKLQVNINTYQSFGNLARKLDILKTEDYLAMRHEAFRNDGQTIQPWDVDLTVWDTTRYTDWQEELLGNTARASHLEGSIGGGNANSQFLVGGTYHRETTVFPGDFSDTKGSAHFNLNNSSLNGKFKTSITGTYLVDNNHLLNYDLTELITQLPPNAPKIYQENGELNWESSTWTNPYSYLYQKYQARTTNLIGNATLSYQLVKGLTIRANLGFTEMKVNEKAIYPGSSYDPAFEQAGSSNFANNQVRTWIAEPMIQWNRNFEHHSFEVLAGGTFQESVREGTTFQATDFISDALLENLAAAGNVKVANTSYSQYRYAAIFGRMNYKWQNEFLVNLTARRDGSSRFGPGKQFANFGAIGAGWIFTQRPWIQRILPFLSFGKIRASYGLTGSDQIGDYGYLELWLPSSYGYQGIPGLQPGNLNNPDYHWETNRKLEASLDLGFLNDRLLFSMNYYYNRSGNQLVGYPLPVITGFNQVQYNLNAEVENKGWEFELNAAILRGEGLKWNSSFNLSLPRNKLVSFPNLAGSSFANSYIIGQSLFTKKYFAVEGVDPETGIYRFKDFNKDGVISYPKDAQVMKTISRTMYGGWQNDFSYKGLRLDLFFEFVQQTGLNYRTAFYMPGGYGPQPDYVLDRWQAIGENSNTQKFTQDYGSAGYSSFSKAQAYGDQNVSDASFIRLKNLSLAYDLPKSWQTAMHLQKAQFYLQGQNLFTLTNYKGWDPENMSFLRLPPLRVWAIGFRITL
ncbi:SusC/RagA family TonB-linked outer membrane protein [Flavihumibacter fluvii]|uniref:SusC/RagA family TonB-linked outer membrane protein n=1 Tax=Flavihumibacter fluvii TaxID=2838157 RepID=UPI001BDF202D|nr:SusC/RagA family TonB-linked outer membrane protein [Flavihumibacter fluvii]ULQ52167.1 SusC/RagA family TonB-linked outer membrane protein [Flavihumibacter fluvii]